MIEATCKACRFVMRPEEGMMPEHGPADNWCSTSKKPVSADTVSDWEAYQKAIKKRRQRLEALVWKHKHPDYKGRREDGTKCVLKLIPSDGTCSVAISSLTDGELVDMLPQKVREAEGFHGFKVLVLGSRNMWLAKTGIGWALHSEAFKGVAHVFTEPGEVHMALEGVARVGATWKRDYI